MKRVVLTLVLVASGFALGASEDRGSLGIILDACYAKLGIFDGEVGFMMKRYPSPSRVELLREGKKTHVEYEVWNRLLPGDRVDFCGVFGLSRTASFKSTSCDWINRSTNVLVLTRCRDRDFRLPAVSNEYWLAMDLKRAWNANEKKELPYPLPYVNPDYGLTSEELRLNRELKQGSEIITQIAKRACGGFKPGLKGQYRLGSDTCCVLCDNDGRLIAALLFASQGDSNRYIGKATISAWRLNPESGSICTLSVYKGFVWTALKKCEDGNCSADNDWKTRKTYIKELMDVFGLNSSDIPDEVFDGSKIRDYCSFNDLINL